MKKSIIFIVTIILLCGCGLKKKLEESYENDTKIEIDNYYLYVTNNDLLLWNKSNNKKYILSDNFLNNDEDFEYYDPNYYTSDNDKMYYISNIDGTKFNLYYADLLELKENEVESKLVVEDITSYKVSNGVIVYEKNSKLYLDGKKDVIAKDVIEYDISKDGKNIYYIDSNNNVYIYNVSKETKKKIESDYEYELIVVDNDLYTIKEVGYLFEIYKNGKLFKENITDYLKLTNKFVYYRYDDSLDKEFDELTNRYEENVLTFDRIEEITNTSDRVLLYLGRPSCSYCDALNHVFYEIQDEKDFSYVYINTSNIDEEELSKILEFGKIDENEFGTPTLIVTENGKAIDSQIGYMEKEEAIKFLEKNKIFDSKFKYENEESNLFTPEIMFWASDTYIVENGKEKLLTKGLLYLTLEEDINSENLLSFNTNIKDYDNVSSEDLYYKLSLRLNSIDGDIKDTKILYSDLLSLYFDNKNNIIAYATDEDVILSKVENGKLKKKESIDYDNLCEISTSKKGPVLIQDCDSIGVGSLYLFNGEELEKISENAYMVIHSTNENIYYVSYDEDKDTYPLYSYSDTETYIDDIYYGEDINNNLFYVVENKDKYDLYTIEGDEPILISKDIDLDFYAIGIN